MRVVRDANVLVHASLAPCGPANGVIALIFTGHVCPLFDERLLDEYDDVLTPPRFALRRHVVERLVRQLRLAGELITAYALPRDLARLMPDAADAAFLEVAIRAKADVLISSNVRHFPSAACAGIAVAPPTIFLQTSVRVIEDPSRWAGRSRGHQVEHRHADHAAAEVSAIDDSAPAQFPPAPPVLMTLPEMLRGRAVASVRPTAHCS